jgi:hypothetical protein
MRKPVITYVGTVKTIEDRENLILVTDQYEVDRIHEYLGYPAEDDDNPIDFCGLFVSIKDGDYRQA